VLVSFVYVVACRLFALVVLLERGDRSKDLAPRPNPRTRRGMLITDPAFSA